MRPHPRFLWVGRLKSVPEGRTLPAMRRLFEMLGDLMNADSRVLAGVLTALGLLIALIVYARLTRVRRLRAQARVIRKR